MRWLAVLFALCACNRVFGVAPTKVVDSRLFDAPIDSPYACPHVGTPLVFSSVLHQVIAQDCSSYSFSSTTGLAVGLCSDATAVFQGPIDEPLVQAIGTPVATADLIVDAPQLSPEGDLMIVTTFDLTTTMGNHRTYLPQADGSWIRDVDLPMPMFGETSVPSRGPERHLIYSDGGTVIAEWSTQGAAWSQVQTYDLAPFVTRFVWLSSDGLRMLLVGAATASTIGEEVMYADRGSIDGHFDPPALIDSLPATDMFINDDCSRAYMSSVQSVFYADQ